MEKEPMEKNRVSFSGVLIFAMRGEMRQVRDGMPGAAGAPSMYGRTSCAPVEGR
jgi:hypothetical protein